MSGANMQQNMNDEEGEPLLTLTQMRQIFTNQEASEWIRRQVEMHMSVVSSRSTSSASTTISDSAGLSSSSLPCNNPSRPNDDDNQSLISYADATISSRRSGNNGSVECDNEIGNYDDSGDMGTRQDEANNATATGSESDRGASNHGHHRVSFPHLPPLQPQSDEMNTDSSSTQENRHIVGDGDEKIKMLESQINEMNEKISAMEGENRNTLSASTSIPPSMEGQIGDSSTFFRNLSGIFGDTTNAAGRLDQDTFSLMMTCDPFSQGWALGLIAYAFQMILGLMIATNQIMEGIGSSVFNIPFRVDPVVRGGQFLTIVLCLSTQSDILSSISTFIIFWRGSNWAETFGVISTGTDSYMLGQVHGSRSRSSGCNPCGGSRSSSSWLVRIALPNTLKLSQGLLVIILSFVIIVQSDNIIDLLKDFTALMVLCETDNVLFQLADMGFLGEQLSIKAAEVKDIEVADGEPAAAGHNSINIDSLSMNHTSIQNTPRSTLMNLHRQSGRSFHSLGKAQHGKRAFYIRSLGLFLLFAAFVSGWIRIVVGQEKGRYFKMKYPNCTSTTGRETNEEMFQLAKAHFGNGGCYGGPLNTLGCGFEGGDCIDFNLAFPLCKGDDRINVQDKLENGICDPDMNIPECEFDGAQCCSLQIIQNSTSFGDGLCNGGEISTEKCVFDNGDCDAFVRDYPDCPIDELAKVEGSSDIILGNEICEGVIYTDDVCGREYRDCDVGQRGPDIIFRGVAARSSLHFKTRMSSDGTTVIIGMYNTAKDDYYNVSSAGKMKLFRYDEGAKVWRRCGGDDLLGHTSKEHFGFGVAMNFDGSRVVVGAHKYNGIMGRVKVLRFDASQNMWVQLGQELIGQSRGYSYMGHSVDMTEDGKRVAVSSPGVSSTDGELFLVGKIQIFAIDLADEEVWLQVGEDIYGKQSEEHLGYYYLKFGSLGSRVYFSIGFDDYPDHTAARVYEYNNAHQKWIQIGSDIPSPYSHLSQRPAISANGNRIAIASWTTHISHIGEVNVFDLDTSTNDPTWKQLGITIVAEGGKAGDGFGYNMGMSSDGNLLAIGSLMPNCLGDAHWCSTGFIQLYKYDPKNPPHRLFSPLPYKRRGDYRNAMQEVERDLDGNIFGWDMTLSGDGSKISVSGYDFHHHYGFVKVYEVDELFYANCIVPHPKWIGDDTCDDYDPYYSEECNYDGGDCPPPLPIESYPDCHVMDPKRIGDGECDDFLPLNSKECGYDGGDCFDHYLVDGYPECFVSHPQWVGNGICEERFPYNTFECGFDNGDCLPSSVISMAPSQVPSFTSAPSIHPSGKPSQVPSFTTAPSIHPSEKPSQVPSFTTAPSIHPSEKPSQVPSSNPSTVPSTAPSKAPSQVPSFTTAPSIHPSEKPSQVPSSNPSTVPSTAPSKAPSQVPSFTTIPSIHPSEKLSQVPSSNPSTISSTAPSKAPSQVPSFTSTPSIHPSERLSRDPTTLPSTMPSRKPSKTSSQIPSNIPSDVPSIHPSKKSSQDPSLNASAILSSRKPSEKPS